MDKMTLWTLAASLACPLVPQVLSIILLRRVMRSQKPHYIALAASGMVQVMSGLWLMRACYKLPLFFDAPLTTAYHEWARVSLDAGPNLATALSLLVGWFWLAIVWSQRKARRKDSCAQLPPATVLDVIGVEPLISDTPSVFVKAKAKHRRDKRKR